MQELSAKYFFNLDGFDHQDLIDLEKVAWDPLLHLKDYFQTQTLGNIEIDIPLGVHLVNPSKISIAKGCVIEPGAYIEGPVILGEGTTIRHGAYIRGYVLTGKGCVIGHATEVKHSILLNHARAAHFNYVGDSILGNDVNLGAGVKIANSRLDKEAITFLYEQKKISTHLRKFGAIIGDHTQIGCNAVTTPGTLIGKHSFCYPCEVIQGVLKEKTRYQTRQPKD
ncbi:UDP-N-acetylglucosamine diphosphorylase [Rhabdochlamydiaceae symbiont of Dictyostelium giganteum]|uniref:acyltransferase n=1 Tax=Rhabdochlamydiaceae symbiont of Dictyostelium giganteum TaxID=3342349 RepID=UPI0038504D3B